MCVSINGPGDLDLLTLKLVCESHERWGTFIPNLGTLGLRVLELMLLIRYVSDGRTDTTNAYCVLSYGWGIKIVIYRQQQSNSLHAIQHKYMHRRDQN